MIPPYEDSLVLGINAAYHESAAAIVRDGEVVLAVEEERLTRRKHAKDARVDNADELPWAAIDLCLAACGAELRDLDMVAYALAPGRRTALVGVDDYPLRDPAGWGSERGEQRFDAGVRAVPALLALRAAEPSLAERVRFVPHHRAHAALAYRGGPFVDTAVMVLDGIGETASGWLGYGTGGALRDLEEIAYPNSIGLLWERVADYLGFGPYEAGTVMGLAAFGDPRHFDPEMSQVFTIPDPDGGAIGADTPPFVVDGNLARFRGDFAGLCSLFGPPRGPDESPVEVRRFAHVAAALQRYTERAVLATARRLAGAGLPRVVYTGGVALNCVANTRLEVDGPFDELYIPGPSHDAGTAVGAALEVVVRPPVAGTVESPLVGPAFAAEAVDAAIERAGETGRRVACPATLAAERIAGGDLVGWFQGRLELGPRALGSRSLLADPRTAGSRAALNQRIKQRDSFRPFAASCLEEHADQWFELPTARTGATWSRDAMLLAYRIRPDRRDRIPAVTHVDGTCRIHTVSAERQPLFHRLLCRFHERTGVPMVLNTSFNQREPIVCSPEHALASFRRTGLDVLIMGDRVVER